MQISADTSIFYIIGWIPSVKKEVKYGGKSLK